MILKFVSLLIVYYSCSLLCTLYVFMQVVLLSLCVFWTSISINVNCL